MREKIITKVIKNDCTNISFLVTKTPKTNKKKYHTLGNN